MSKSSSDIQVQLPPVIDQDGKTTVRGSISLGAPGKPPTLRFRPGTIVKIQSELWEVLYAFRFANDPTVWRYRCERRDSVAPIAETNARALKEQTLKRGEGTPRVVKELFRNHQDRENFFYGIPVYGEQMTFTSRTLLHGYVMKEGGES